MAWLRSRIERSTGVTTWAIEWREGGREGVVRSRSLGAVTEKEAEFQLAAEHAGRGGLRRGAPAVTTPKKAVDAFLKHLKVSGRRQGTVDHAEDKMQPLLTEWSDRPMAKWTRSMLESLLAERGWGTSRVRGALGVYRRFIAWCAAVGYACGDFVGDFKPPRARPLEHREALSAEQCRRLLDAARPVPEDPPDRGYVRPRRRQQGRRRVPELVPAAVGDPGLVHEAVERVVEGRVVVGDPPADPAGPLALALQDVLQGGRDREPEPGPCLVAGASD